MIVVDEAKGLYDEFFNPEEDPKYYIYDTKYAGKINEKNVNPLLTFDTVLDEFSYTNKVNLPSFSTVGGKFTNDTLNRAEGFSVSLVFGIKLANGANLQKERAQVKPITEQIELLQNSLTNLYIPYIAQRYEYDNVHIEDYTPVDISPEKINYYFWRINFKRIRVSSTTPQFTNVDPNNYRKPQYAP